MHPATRTTMKSAVASFLWLVIATTQAQWLMHNYGYEPAAAAFADGGYYPADGIPTAYTGYPSRAGPYYGFAHPGYWPSNAYHYPAASVPSYDMAGNQVGGYGQVQDTAEVAQAKAAHFAAHAAVKARLIRPVATALDDGVAATTPAEAVVATGVSRKKRQILPLNYGSPFAYGSNSSPLAYNRLAAHPGHSYGAPFGYHFVHPYDANPFDAVLSSVAAPVVGSAHVDANTASTSAAIASTVTVTA